MSDLLGDLGNVGNLLGGLAAFAALIISWIALRRSQNAAAATAATVATAPSLPPPDLYQQDTRYQVLLEGYERLLARVDQLERQEAIRGAIASTISPADSSGTRGRLAEGIEPPSSSQRAEAQENMAPPPPRNLPAKTTAGERAPAPVGSQMQDSTVRGKGKKPWGGP